MMNQPNTTNAGAEDWSMPVYPAANGDRLIPVGRPLVGDGALELTGGRLLAQAHDAHGTPAPDYAAEDHGPATTQAVDAHAATGDAAAGHGDEHAEHPAGYMMPHEIPNLAMLIEAAQGNMHPHHGERPHPSTAWFINPAYSIFFVICITLFIRRSLRARSIERPGRAQNLVETLLGGLKNFFGGILGAQGEKYVPFILSLFLFIWINNLAGIVPFFKAPTSSFKTTFALGLCTFFYVQFNAIKAGGFGNWIKHLMGEPLWMAPLNFPLHVMGELIKPVSLSLRLFGNIFGEDKLLAAFLGMGMLLVSVMFHVETPMVGLPLHLPFFFLALLTCTIQATVFSLLASVYIVLLLPHDHDHDDEQGHGDEGNHGHGQAPGHAA